VDFGIVASLWLFISRKYAGEDGQGNSGGTLHYFNGYALGSHLIQ